MRYLISLLLLCVGCSAQTTINIGSTNNDGQGDTLRSAFGKINTNFLQSMRGFQQAVSVAELLSITATNAYVTNAYVAGYYTANDGGGGLFRWNPTSTVATNLGTVFKLSIAATGRWERITTQPWNVKWFGAKGDGTNDDYAAFVSAIAAITNAMPVGDYQFHAPSPSGSPALYLPAGNYKITNTINLFSHVAILGENRHTTKVTSAHTNAPLFYIGHYSGDSNFAYTNSGQKISKYVRIENLTLQGSNVKTAAHTSATITNHAIRIDGLYHGFIRNLQIQDFGGNGLEINRAQWLNVNDVDVYYSRIGVNIDAAASSAYTGEANNVTMYFDRLNAWFNHQGIRCGSTSGIRFSNCISENNDGIGYNGTVDGTVGGAKKEPDDFYLPSINILFTNASQIVFKDGYLETAYIHVFITNSFSIQFENTFFNTTDGNSVTNDNGVEWASQHDILQRGNLIGASGTNNPPNQAFILFGGTGGIGNRFENCWFANSPDPVAAAIRPTSKRIKFLADNYGYPFFRHCFGLVYDDGTNVFSGTNPRIALEVHPNQLTIDSTIKGLTNVIPVGWNRLTALPAQAHQISEGVFPAQYVFDANAHGVNVYKSGFALLGSGDQRTIYQTLNQRVGFYTNPPTAGTWSSGDIVWNSNATNNGNAGWIYASGAWRQFGRITYNAVRYLNTTNAHLVLDFEGFVTCDTTVAAGAFMRVDLPSAALNIGRQLVIKDYGNNAAARNIRIHPFAGDNINKLAINDYLAMNSNWQTVRLFCDGTSWIEQ